MCEGYDASQQLKILYETLPEGGSILELGSGPGNDLELLVSHYQATGSDYSPVFIEMLEKCFPSLPLLTLDAVTIGVGGTFYGSLSDLI
jgi:hypothetical protein